MKVFITGGSGYIGRNIIGALVKRGDDVYALSRTIQSGEVVEKLGATVIAGDLTDSKALRNGMRECEVVIHCAGKVDTWGNPLDFHRANIAGTQQVIHACQATHRPRLIYISSCTVVADGNAKIHIDESTPIPRKPIGLYPLTKSIAERYVATANSDSLETIILRAPWVWGGDNILSIPNLREAIQNNRWIWINQGHHLISTCHVDNLVAGVLLATQHGDGGNCYFLSDGHPVELRNFVTNLLKTQHMSAPDRNLPKWMASLMARVSEFAVRRFELEQNPWLTRTTVALMSAEFTVNDQKARNELGYMPIITREAGMADLARRARQAKPQA